MRDIADILKVLARLEIDISDDIKSRRYVATAALNNSQFDGAAIELVHLKTSQAELMLVQRLRTWINDKPFGYFDGML